VETFVREEKIVGGVNAPATAIRSPTTNVSRDRVPVVMIKSDIR
jgi:hypothetical protein